MPEKPKIEIRRDDGVELENQFILRLPEEPAQALREAVREGANNLKDRLSIRLDNDVRYGEVRYDQWLMHAKVVDLPTIIESLKSVDLKNFYKTADICQMMICKMEPEEQPIEEESPSKNKKKDPNKVDKKFLHPHGVTPPLKNVRRRRFRKTLKKKYVEAPEIEKEVKRLLRVDNEAVSVKWEVITEDEETAAKASKHDDEPKTTKGHKGKKKDQAAASHAERETPGTSRDVAEHDIFGGEVSDSDEEDTNIRQMIELDETSRLSADDSRSRMSDSNSMQYHDRSEKLQTEFSQSMFNSSADSPTFRQHQQGEYFGSEQENDFLVPQSSQESRDVNVRINDLEQQVTELKQQKIQKELEISSIENETLRKRLQDNLDSLGDQIREKESEIQNLQSGLF
ncbi:transcription initiation factor TFIID subunit 7 [Culicoides brevitarsis]|uniref:transcription initiation factor TFIID subunit 7 n=1 Tax=Culicoides brevitarsis TaxID=469753 RepID=UPI00307B7D4F